MIAKPLYFQCLEDSGELPVIYFRLIYNDILVCNNNVHNLSKRPGQHYPDRIRRRHPLSA
jgi:hypothetical protein